MMMNQGQRVIIFALVFGSGMLLILALTAFLFLQSLNNAPRSVAVAQQEGITVEEYAILPDDDSYPAALTVSADGTVFTGSYDTGAVWSVSSTGEINEIPGTRDIIGAVTGLTFSPNGTLYILDRIESSPSASGGVIWRLTPDGQLFVFGSIPDDFISPDDIVTDADGKVYVTDRGRREIWRFDPTGTPDLWWTVPETDERADDVLPTGLAYDPVQNAILLTDTLADTIYRITLPDKTTDILYRYMGSETVPGFDGITVAPDGRVYVAAFNQRAVVELRDGELIPLAQGFRGGSDVEYYDERLYVTNFDQRSIALPGIVEPQLPFALDVITLPADA